MPLCSHSLLSTLPILPKEHSLCAILLTTTLGIFRTQDLVVTFLCSSVLSCWALSHHFRMPENLAPNQKPPLISHFWLPCSLFQLILNRTIRRNSSDILVGGRGGLKILVERINKWEKKETQSLITYALSLWIKSIAQLSIILLFISTSMKG